MSPNVCRRGVQLMLGGVNYPNNSIIQFDSIHYTPDHCHSLLCTTDRIPCCSDTQGGNWYHAGSNGRLINVVSSATTADYYQNRENDGTLRLIRRDDTVQSTESEIYCCQLSDTSLFIHNLCVTIGIKFYCTNQCHMPYFLHSYQFTWSVAVTGWPALSQQQCNRATRNI